MNNIYGLPEKTEDWLHNYLYFLQEQINAYGGLVKNALPGVDAHTKEIWGTIAHANRNARDLIIKRAWKLSKQENSEGDLPSLPQ